MEISARERLRLVVFIAGVMHLRKQLRRDRDPNPGYVSDGPPPASGAAVPAASDGGRTLLARAGSPVLPCTGAAYNHARAPERARPNRPDQRVRLSEREQARLVAAIANAYAPTNADNGAG